jgi:uncharacterized protein (DUF1778 family)
MTRPAVGPRLSVRLRDDQRSLLDAIAGARHATGAFPPGACTAAAVLRDLLDRVASDDAAARALLTQLTSPPDPSGQRADPRTTP